MTRLRLWLDKIRLRLARLLLPRGWGVAPIQPGKVYALRRAAEHLEAGALVVSEWRHHDMPERDDIHRGE